jgi:NTE family protein
VEGNIHTSAGYRSDVLLSDGGVYDNLGLESVWDVYRTVLVSDAGGHVGPDPDPEKDWARGIIRVLHIIDSQVRALRRRAVIDNFNDDHDPHNGFFISTISDYSKWRPGKRPYMVVDNRVTERLAAISTRLTDLPDEQHEMLINWGFAAADAGILARLDADLPVAPWPYPERPLT